MSLTFRYFTCLLDKGHIIVYTIGSFVTSLPLNSNKNRGAQGTPILNLLQNPQGWFIIRLENRRILECPTVAQSETYKALSLLTDYRLSPIGVEDSLSVYLRLCLLSMYVKAANTTSKSVSTSKVFIPTSFLFPERTTARLSLLL